MSKPRLTRISFGRDAFSGGMVADGTPGGDTLVCCRCSDAVGYLDMGFRKCQRCHAQVRRCGMLFPCLLCGLIAVSQLPAEFDLIMNQCLVFKSIFYAYLNMLSPSPSARQTLSPIPSVRDVPDRLDLRQHFNPHGAS